MRGLLNFFGVLGLLLVSKSALADFDATASQIAPRDAFLRAQAVLDYFKVPLEADTQPLIQELSLKQTLPGVKAMLPFLDPHAQWVRFSSADSLILRGFQDRDSKVTTDFEVSLSEDPSAVELLAPFELRIQQAAQSNPKEKLLQGLRIAIDPGHMGTALWDDRTGKYIVDSSGRKLSEGVLNLQTALLLEKEFQGLGAEVFLTRRGLAPVTPLEYEKLDLREFGQIELRQSVFEGWFQKLLSAGPPGASLYKAFESSSEVKKFFSERSRTYYFISRADLEARAVTIGEFSPDITFVVHYDTNNPPENPHGLNPKGYNRTKIYIAGAFEKEEFSSREDRRFFAQHLLNPRAWNSSLRLSRQVVRELKEQLRIEFDPSGGSAAVQVEPGVYSRNLALSRKIHGHALSFLECLHYNAPAEFDALSRTRHPLLIDGVNHPYSDRLTQVVQAIKSGLISFVESYKN
jgi:hypothetical protein